MQTAAVTEFEGTDGIGIVEVDDPAPDPGEALVRIEACSLNRRDLGSLYGAGADEDDLPYVPCSDAAGVVEAVGDDVGDVSPGDRVVACPNRTCGTCRYCRAGPENFCERFSIEDGALAEFAAVPADRLVSLPDSVSFEAAAALPVAYVTAWRMFEVADVEPGELLFVPGATGGVGVACIQLASMLGAETIGTSRSSEKLARLADIGATHLVESDDPDAIKSELRGIGRADAALNHMGGEYTDVGLKALRLGGRMVLCGSTVDSESAIDLPNFYLGQKSLLGSTMGTQNDLETLVDLIAAGRIDPAIGGGYDLAEATAAFEDLAERRAFGKLVIHP